MTAAPLAGSLSQRAYIERNSIALLSNHGKLGTTAAIDPTSRGWLGFHCANPKVRLSGLWNDDHVTDGRWGPEFLSRFEQKVDHL